MKRRAFINGLTSSIFVFKTIKPYFGTNRKIISNNNTIYIPADSTFILHKSLQNTALRNEIFDNAVYQKAITEIILSSLCMPEEIILKKLDKIYSTYITDERINFLRGKTIYTKD